MTFDLSSEQQALQARARAAAQERIAPLASGIDTDGALPANLGLDDVLGTAATDVDRAIVIEELAAVSAAAGAAAGLRAAGVGLEAADADLPGLRGLGAVDAALSAASAAAAASAQVVLAAVAVGIGRAAVEQALAALRASGDRASGNADARPAWAMADAATEVEGARLLTMQAAQAVTKGAGLADARLAKLFAADVAGRAVDTALRILGPEGYRRGTLTERLTRDARTIALIGGTAESERASVAAATLPA